MRHRWERTILPGASVNKSLPGGILQGEGYLSSAGGAITAEIICLS